MAGRDHEHREEIERPIYREMLQNIDRFPFQYFFPRPQSFRALHMKIFEVWLIRTWRHQSPAACLRGFESFDMTGREIQSVCFARSWSDHVRYAFHVQWIGKSPSLWITSSSVGHPDLRERRRHEEFYSKLCERFPCRTKDRDCFPSNLRAR